ncbi:hypothetical protein N643_14370 [Salmonella bongori serovar 48:z41:-- str. RKS3044]|nr:hypothetical protein N643_14370 [Salmonella bongori serovar 48:z41:-- str. RKS3044]
MPPSGNVMPDGASAYQAYSLNTVLISKGADGPFFVFILEN